MASEPTLKVKLVKCPKCWKILPLLMEMHIYKCGGCCTLLQAKGQGSGTGTIAGSPESVASQKKEFNDNSEDKELMSLNRNSAFLSSEIHPLEKNDDSGARDYGSCSGEEHGGVGSLHKDSEDEKSDQNEHRDSDIEQVAVVNQSTEEEMSVINNQDNSSDINNLQPGATNLKSEDGKDNNDQTASGDCSPVVYPKVADLSSLDEKYKCDHSKLGECIMDQKHSNDVNHGLVNLKTEDSGAAINHDVPRNYNAEEICDSNSEQLKLRIKERNNQKDHHVYGDCNGDWHEIMNRFISQSGPASCVDEDNLSAMGDDFRGGRGGGTSISAEMKSEENMIWENNYNDRTASRASQETTTNLRVKIHAPADVFISSDNLPSSPIEQPEHSQRSIPYCGSDSYAATEYGDHSPEFSGNLENVSNSSNSRGFHIDDESDSHYDRTNYQQHCRHSQPLRDTDEVPEFVLSGRRNGMNRHFVTPTKYRSAELHGLARSPISMGKNSDIMENRWSGQIYGETTGHNSPIMNWGRSESERYSFGAPLHQENCLAGYESGGPSILRQQDTEKDPSYSSPDRLEGIIQERKELLRTVYELEDQLNKKQYMEGTSRGAPNEAVWREMLSCYNKEATDEGPNHDFNYVASPIRSKGGSNMSNGQRFSRIPYSGEVSNSRYCIKGASNHHPRDWRFSAPLPSSTPHQKFELPRSQLGYSPYSSITSSPQPFLDSRYYPKDSELLSIDLTNEDYATKRQIKVESNSSKQHFLPTAGGAPFVTCYRCLNLLQLPSDLLLFQRRSIRLKCGSCSTLLKFSFQDRTHVVPYLGNTTSLPHEVDGNGDVSNEKNMTPTSHSSTREDMNPALYSPQGNTSKQKLSCSAPLEPKKYQRNVARKQSRKKYWDPETQEFLPTVGSPLHKLMGYASAREVLTGYDTSPDRTSTHNPATRY